MYQVHRLTVKVYAQCLVLMAIIGVLLVVFTAKAPFKDIAPLANDIMSVVGITLFLLLAFFAFTCGSEDAQTKFLLIILISVFLGLASGFFLAMNVSASVRDPTLPKIPRMSEHNGN